MRDPCAVQSVLNVSNIGMSKMLLFDSVITYTVKRCYTIKCRSLQPTFDVKYNVPEEDNFKIYHIIHPKNK